MADDLDLQPQRPLELGRQLEAELVWPHRISRELLQAWLGLPRLRARAQHREAHVRLARVAPDPGGGHAEAHDSPQRELPGPRGTQRKGKAQRERAAFAGVLQLQIQHLAALDVGEPHVLRAKKHALGTSVSSLASIASSTVPDTHAQQWRPHRAGGQQKLELIAP